MLLLSSNFITFYMPKLTIEINEGLLNRINQVIESGLFFDHTDYITYCIRQNLDRRNEIESLRKELELLENEVGDTRHETDCNSLK